MALIKRKEEVYTFEEYFALRELERKNIDIKRTDKVIAHIKRNKNRYAFLVFILALLLFSYTPEKIVEVLVISTQPQSLPKLNPTTLTTFNEYTVKVLIKLYMAICMGAVVVETVTSGWKDEKKFTATVVKYAICFGGGLFCISILNMLRMMIL